MKTNLKTGCKRQHSGKPGLGLLPSLRRASAPHPAALATRHLSLARLEEIRRGRQLPTQFLIANPELEFSATHRKHSPLRISNRKFSRVFHSYLVPTFSWLVPHHSSLATRSSALVTHHQPLSLLDEVRGGGPLATSSLIYASAIRNPRK